MSGIWDYPAPPEYNEPRPLRDEDDAYEEWRDRKIWAESQEFLRQE
jgi:hypothetical protein